MSHELLQRHDDPKRWEYPKVFDYKGSNVYFLAFASSLNEEFGTHLKAETGSDIQDASFHSQIYFSVGLERFHLIRFSNFGDMVAVNDDSEMPDEILERIKKLLTQHKYNFVPCSHLDVPYTGSNPGVTGIDSWWIRYFDWV